MIRLISLSPSPGYCDLINDARKSVLKVLGLEPGGPMHSRADGGSYEYDFVRFDEFRCGRAGRLSFAEGNRAVLLRGAGCVALPDDTGPRPRTRFGLAAPDVASVAKVGQSTGVSLERQDMQRRAPWGPPLPHMGILTGRRLRLRGKTSTARRGASRAYRPCRGLAGFSTAHDFPLSPQASVRCSEGVTLPASAGCRRDARPKNEHAPRGTTPCSRYSIDGRV
jgi:hypothetical protein